MRKFMAFLLVFVLTLLIAIFISMPFILSLKNMHTFTEIERILLNVIITGISVFLGILIHKINDKSIKKWKSALMSACHSLIAMSAQTGKVKASHENSRKKIEEYIPDDNDGELNNLKNIFNLKCNSCAEQMDHLKLHIDTSIDYMENMIDTLCEEPYCSQIHEAILEKKQRIGLEQQNNHL